MTKSTRRGVIRKLVGSRIASQAATTVRWTPFMVDDGADASHAGEKRKQKLALLNQILDGEEAQLDQEHQADTSYLIAIDESLPVAGTSEGPREAITTSTNEVPFGDIWGDLPDSSNIGFEQTPFLDQMKTPDVPISQGLELDSFLTWDPASSTQSLFGDVTGPAEGTQSLQRTTLPNNSYFDLLKGVDSLSFHQKKALLRHIQRETHGSSAASQVSPRSMSPTFPSTGELEIMHQRGLRLEAQHFAQALHRTASRRGPAPMPSQYVLQGGFFGALMANCYAIGMGSVDALLVEDGWSVFSLAPDLGYHPSQLPLVRARFQDMTPDLRPVDMQLTFAHHPYLVCSGILMYARFELTPFRTSFPSAHSEKTPLKLWTKIPRFLMRMSYVAIY